MTTTPEPLVAVVCTVPLVAEATCAALDGVAACSVFPGRRPELGALLKALRPQAVVTDDEAEALVAATYARFARVPVVVVSLRENSLRVLEDGVAPAGEYTAGPETVRAVLADRLHLRAPE